MRSPVVLALALVLMAAGCRSPGFPADGVVVHERDRELMELADKKKAAVFDLSDTPPSNGAQAYQNEQAGNHARR